MEYCIIFPCVNAASGNMVVDCEHRDYPTARKVVVSLKLMEYEMLRFGFLSSKSANEVAFVILSVC